MFVDRKKGSRSQVRFAIIKRDLNNCIRFWQRLKNFYCKVVGEGTYELAGVRRKFVLGWFFCAGIDVAFYFWVENKLIVVSLYTNSEKELSWIKTVYEREINRVIRIYNCEPVKKMSDGLQEELYEMVRQARFYEHGSQGLSSEKGFKAYLDEYFY